MVVWRIVCAGSVFRGLLRTFPIHWAEMQPTPTIYEVKLWIRYLKHDRIGKSKQATIPFTHFPT
jgi:hypothetical protein